MFSAGDEYERGTVRICCRGAAAAAGRLASNSK